MQLRLKNSLTNAKEDFLPIYSDNVRIYACGPTVYDVPHLGNSRAIVIYDVLFRVLQFIYGENEVTYVRNITDIDDKIIERARKMGITVNELTSNVTDKFHEICNKLNCLSPTIEPKATEHLSEMFDLIHKLLENDMAYESNGHVYFRVNKFSDYGKLSGRKIEELIAGSRVETSKNKENSADFVLWKPSEDDFCAFDSPFGKGRPGWHLECSAMSVKYLSENFDIHGGGADLMFPHHTNEIAQTCGAYEDAKFANYWVHNGFLTVDGQKMSKSLNNFITPVELFEKNINAEIIRFCLLQTHYRKPFDWNDEILFNAQKNLKFFYEALSFSNDSSEFNNDDLIMLIQPIFDDLNLSKFFANLHNLAKDIHKLEDENQKIIKANLLKKAGGIIGIFYQNSAEFLQSLIEKKITEDEVERILAERNEAKRQKKWQKADELRDFLNGCNVEIKDGPNLTTKWSYK